MSEPVKEPTRKTIKTVEGHAFHHVDGKMHSENDKPAVVYADGTQWWYKNGAVHRDTGPAVILANGVQEYWQNNQRHRTDGPALIYPTTTAIAPQMRGVQQWWTQGKLVREDVPPNVKRFRAMVEQAHKACFKE